MEEAGGRECGESRVEDRGSCRSNEMEGSCENDCGRDEVYPAAFGDEDRTGLKLDMMMMPDQLLKLVLAVFKGEKTRKEKQNW